MNKKITNYTAKPNMTETTASVPETIITQSYVICIDSFYVRDAQYFIPEHPLEDGEDIGEKMDSDNNWADADKYNLFLGIYKWNAADEDGLRAYISAKHDVYAESILIIPVEEEKCSTPTILRMIEEQEFHNLKVGDVVYIKICGETCPSKVVNKPFWNSDADEPGWEIETSNGFSDIYSLYVQEI